MRSTQYNPCSSYEKTINIDGVDPILFVGLNDQNIKVLGESYNSKIVVRGSSMNLDGKKEEIIDIELVVQNMLTIINQKAPYLSMIYEI